MTKKTKRRKKIKLKIEMNELDGEKSSKADLKNSKTGFENEKDKFQMNITN